MKIKLSKIMAAVTAIGVTFAGFTAMAAVTTTTSYDYTEIGNAGATVDVETVVSDVKAGDEITYYVHNSAISANEGILYIDQQTVPTGATSVTFNFSGVKQADLYATTTVAKNGADIVGWNVNDTSFAFNHGANYISTAPDGVEYDSNWTAVATDSELTSGYTNISYTGKVLGNPYEYGVVLTINEVENVCLPAKGCDATGTFVVVLEANNADLASTITSAKAYTRATATSEITVYDAKAE